jgi:hypothetical protein
MAKRKLVVCLEGADPAQIIMPGVRPVSFGERLNWQAQLPMQPRRAQKPLDIGFWGPMRDQLEMF